MLLFFPQKYTQEEVDNENVESILEGRFNPNNLDVQYVQLSRRTVEKQELRN